MTDHTIYFDVLKQSIGLLFHGERTYESKTAQLAERLASLIESHGGTSTFPAGPIVPAASVFSRLNGHEGMMYFPGEPGSIPYALRTRAAVPSKRLQSLKDLQELLLQKVPESLEEVNRILAVLEQEARNYICAECGRQFDGTLTHGYSKIVRKITDMYVHLVIGRIKESGESNGNS